MNAVWTWLLANGDKTAAFVTGVAALMSANATALGIAPKLIEWITFAGAVVTLAHTVFVSPDTQQNARLTLKGGFK